MQNKIVFFLVVLLGQFVLDISAQNILPTPAPKAIDGGVINGKAMSLPKPEYPPAARAVKAGGAVNVQVTIDENGDVISAAAVSGHPLLRIVAEKAARGAKFNPTLLSGEPVKVTGIIVYNFIPANTTRNYSTNWMEAGMTLAALEKSPTLRYFEPKVLTQMILPEWTSENQQIQRIIELKESEANIVNNDFPKERIISEKTTKNPNDSLPTTTRITTANNSPERNVSSESIALAQTLISSIQGRLSIEPFDLWYFNLGISINRGLDKADSRLVDERVKSAQKFRQAIEFPPKEVSADVVDELQKMASMIERGIFTDEDKISFTQSLMKLHSISPNQ